MKGRYYNMTKHTEVIYDDKKNLPESPAEKARLLYQPPKLIILNVMLTETGSNHLAESSDGLLES